MDMRSDRSGVLAFNQAYLTEFEAALAASHSAGELIAAMKRKSRRRVWTGS